MLNTPQVSFAEQTPNSQAPKSQISLSGEQNWDQTLYHFDNQQKTTVTQFQNNQNGQTVTVGLENAVGRADTLDRIPVFVNPHDLNQTSHGPQGNQETPLDNTHKQSESNPTSHAVTQSQQSQITLASTPTQQVRFYYYHFCTSIIKTPKKTRILIYFSLKNT